MTASHDIKLCVVYLIEHNDITEIGDPDPPFTDI